MGVEGTGSYGAELSRVLTRRGMRVVEVMRPNRQARAILDTAPEAIRAKYRGMTSPALMAAMEKARPAGARSEPLTSTATVLKRLAVRYRHLHQELALIDADLDAILTLDAPVLRAIHGGRRHRAGRRGSDSRLIGKDHPPRAWTSG